MPATFPLVLFSTFVGVALSFNAKFHSSLKLYGRPVANSNTEDGQRENCEQNAIISFDDKDDDDDVWYTEQVFDKSVGFYSFQRDKEETKVLEENIEYLDNYTDSETKRFLSSIIREFIEGPLDSVTTVRYKIFKQSLTLLVFLLASIFTISYYVFPSSFLQYSPEGQYLTQSRANIDTSINILEVPEYSESGAVLFFDNDEPMSKTTVTVIQGSVYPNLEDKDESILAPTSSSLPSSSSISRSNRPSKDRGLSTNADELENVRLVRKGLGMVIDRSIK